MGLWPLSSGHWLALSGEEEHCHTTINWTWGKIYSSKTSASLTHSFSHPLTTLALCTAHYWIHAALGLDAGSTLKSAINSLLAALCRYSRLWYLFVTAAADSALPPTTLQEVSDSGRVLHTLAQVSQSDECINILLSSSLISSIAHVSNIHVTTTKLLDPSPSITIRTALARQLLTTECTHMATSSPTAFRDKD